jgi:hypothetical protein
VRSKLGLSSQTWRKERNLSEGGKKEIGEKKELEEDKMRLEYKFDLLKANKKKMKRSCKFMNNDIVIYGSKNIL